MLWWSDKFGRGIGYQGKFHLPEMPEELEELKTRLRIELDRLQCGKDPLL